MKVDQRLRVSEPGDIFEVLRRQFGSLWRQMLPVYVLVIVALCIIIAARVATGISIAELTRDPLQLAGAPIYTGILSSIGALIWAATIAICVFSYALTRDRMGGDEQARFLLAGAFVTAMLLVDDLFMFHEIVFPVHLGVPENVAYIMYAGVLIWFLVAFRAAILQTNFLLLVVALGCFAFSLGVDRTDAIIPYPGLYLFEDGSKLFGIVSWTAYFATVGAQQIERYSGGNALTVDTTGMPMNRP